jgi:hypothetical protein
MPLTDLDIRDAKPRDKAFRLFDGGELYFAPRWLGASSGAS